MNAPWAGLIGGVCALLGAGCAQNPSHAGVTPMAMGFAASAVQQPAIEMRPSLVVSEPPPAPTSQPREIVPRRPAHEAVWIGGHWSYTNYREEPYEWLPGHWEIPPSGRGTWIPDAWQQQGERWIYVRGHWQ